MKETNTISMMNFEDFKKVIMKKAEPVAGEGGTVDITHVIKNNGCEYDGLIILNKGSVISPTIYLNDYYEQYQIYQKEKQKKKEMNKNQLED